MEKPKLSDYWGVQEYLCLFLVSFGAFSLIGFSLLLGVICLVVGVILYVTSEKNKEYQRRFKEWKQEQEGKKHE